MGINGQFKQCLIDKEIIPDQIIGLDQIRDLGDKMAMEVPDDG